MGVQQDLYMDRGHWSILKREKNACVQLQIHTEWIQTIFCREKSKQGAKQSKSV